MSHKDRRLWESLQQQALDISGCKHCGRWGDTPDEVIDEDGVPVACELITSERIYQYETALAMPPWTVVAHNIHMMFMPDEKCGTDCGVVKTRYTSGFGGLTIYQRIKMAVNVEDIASMLTDLHGNTTLTAACPFHQGSGRELVIWTDIQEWKCYGRCQMGGDVIHFIQACKKEGFEWVLPKLKEITSLTK
jgi:hypothetical protein